MKELIEKKEQGFDAETCICHYLNKYKEEDKKLFYPFVHSLLTIIGLECHGEVGRMDAMCKYKGHIIPAEIKSRTETTTYNVKGLRQAIENKILALNTSLENDMNYSTFVIGFDHPSSDTFVRDFIEKAYEKWGIKIVASDLRSLISMSIRKVWENEQIDLDRLLDSYGIINE